MGSFKDGRPICSECEYHFSITEYESLYIYLSEQINGVKINLGTIASLFEVNLMGPRHMLVVVNEKFFKTRQAIKTRNGGSYMVLGTYDTEQEAIKIFNDMQMLLQEL